MEKLTGTQITKVYPYYENLLVYIDDPSSPHGFKTLFMTPEELLVILNEFDFELQKKRTRTWITLEGGIDDWRVERFDEPRSY